MPPTYQCPRGLAQGTRRQGQAGTPPNRHHPKLPPRLKRYNRLIARRRAAVETTFATWKNRIRLTRIRYIGLVKAQAQVMLAAIAFNLRRWAAITAYCARERPERPPSAAKTNRQTSSTAINHADIRQGGFAMADRVLGQLSLADGLRRRMRRSST